MTYRFHPEAEAELLDTVAYYEARKAGLGARYPAEFEQVLQQVCTSPHRYRVDYHPDVRRVRMQRFPFTIFYRLKFRDSLTEMDSRFRGNDVISARRVAFRLVVIPAKAGIHRLIQAF